MELYEHLIIYSPFTFTCCLFRFEIENLFSYVTNFFHIENFISSELSCNKVPKASYILEFREFNLQFKTKEIKYILLKL